MGDSIYVKTGEMAVGGKNLSIQTGGVGSCLVICLFDKEAQIGGMAHAMLPHSPEDRDEKPSRYREGEGSARFVDDAIDYLMEELIGMGADKKNLKAKLIGGAKMFAILSKDRQSIGERNVIAAREKFEQLSIPIVKEDVGGTVGRSIDFTIANSVVDVLKRV
jgi:chemotaxis protein CheD